MTTADRIKRRKPAHARKEEQLRVRVAEAHMDAFRAAAARAGISLSAWVTERLLRCARQESRQEKQQDHQDRSDDSTSIDVDPELDRSESRLTPLPRGVVHQQTLDADGVGPDIGPEILRALLEHEKPA